MKLVHWTAAAILGMTIAGCQGISASQAEKMPMLNALPLLVVKSTQPTAKGYQAMLKGDDNTAYRAAVNKTDVKNYVKISSGDRVKIDGDYVGENPVEIKAIQVYKMR